MVLAIISGPVFHPIFSDMQHLIVNAISSSGVNNVKTPLFLFLLYSLYHKIVCEGTNKHIGQILSVQYSQNLKKKSLKIRAFRTKLFFFL